MIPTPDESMFRKYYKQVIMLGVDTVLACEFGDEERRNPFANLRERAKLGAGRFVGHGALLQRFPAWWLVQEHYACKPTHLRISMGWL